MDTSLRWHDGAGFSFSCSYPTSFAIPVLPITYTGPYSAFMYRASFILTYSQEFGTIGQSFHAEAL